MKRYLLIILIFAAGCSDIRLIGAYDQSTDNSIQKMSKDVSTLLIKLQKNYLDQRPDTTYLSFREQYIQIEGDIAALRIRTSALPKYQKIREQVDLVRQNIELLEELHKTNFSLPGKSQYKAIEDIKVIFETQFTAMLTLQEGLKREKAN